MRDLSQINTKLLLKKAVLIIAAIHAFNIPQGDSPTTRKNPVQPVLRFILFLLLVSDCNRFAGYSKPVYYTNLDQPDVAGSGMACH
ncbi:hypothetical protein [Phocaeicola plebeius]|uniref:hypothetical protein n=1 Tax=Phocaeicola plebeius TaxID=310297 RepID=UPI003F95890A